MVIRTIVVHRGHEEIENGSKDALAEIFFALFHRGRLSSLGHLTMNWLGLNGLESGWKGSNTLDKSWTSSAGIKISSSRKLKKVPERNLQSFLSHVSNLGRFLGAVRESSGGIFSSRSWPCNRAPLGRRRPVWVRSSSSVRRSSPTTPASGWSSRPAPRRRTSRPRASLPMPRWTSSEKFEDKADELTVLLGSSFVTLNQS